ncbi:hypothetical protein JCM8208_001645 [Rhodotorula glutinis]
MPALRLSALGLVFALLSSAMSALGACIPSLPAPSAGADGLLNVFAMGRAVATWDYVPPSSSWPKAGGALYLSQIDTPEDGAFYVVERASLDPAHEDPVWTLSLGSQEPSVQCVSASGKMSMATTGSCDELEAEFELSCLSCPSTAASSSSSTAASGTSLARGCTLRSVAAGGQCLTAVYTSSTSVTPRIATRTCKGSRAAGQVWDLRLA